MVPPPLTPLSSWVPDFLVELLSDESVIKKETLEIIIVSTWYEILKISFIHKQFY